MKEYYIGDFLKRIKRPIPLNENEDYRLVTIRINHKGIKLRGTKKGHEIKSKMYEVRQGDFILSGIDARHGAFGIIPKELDGAIVTNDFWYFEINESIIDKHLFLQLTATNWFDDICKRGSDGTTQRIRLQKDKFFNQKILLPKPEAQTELLCKLRTIKGKSDALNKEITHQKHLITQLKQAILQEAIEGKLTAEWRKQNSNIEPADQLLERIKAEKQQLIAEKKIKKQKPSLPITQEEIPFELPEGWVWCRLGEICNNITSGSTPSKDSFINGEIPYLKVYNIKNQEVNFFYKPQYIKRSIHETSLKRCILKQGDVIMNIVGPPLGKVAIIPNTFPEWNCNQAIAIFRCLDKEINPFIYQFLCSGIYLSSLNYKGMAGQDNISVTMCKNLILPLPPKNEQAVIIRKVLLLLQKVNTLETQVQQSEAHAKMLTQAVLKEAFEK